MRRSEGQALLVPLTSGADHCLSSLCLRWIDHPAPWQHLDTLEEPRFGIGVFCEKCSGLCFVPGLDDQHAADHPLAIRSQKRPADPDALAVGFQEVEMGGRLARRVSRPSVRSRLRATKCIGLLPGLS